MDIKYSEFRKKEVFNISTGENYGKVQDFVFNSKSGKIETIIVPGKRNAFLNCESIEIKFCDIEKIGRDAILVKIGSCRKKECEPINVCCNQEVAPFEDEE